MIWGRMIMEDINIRRNLKLDIFNIFAKYATARAIIMPDRSRIRGSGLPG
jgi:hypothetical protein